MRQYRFWRLTLFTLLFPAVPLGAEGSGHTGTVKGTITIGGRRAAAVVVSVEGLPKESRQSKISSKKSKGDLVDQRDTKFIPHVLR